MKTAIDNFVDLSKVLLNTTSKKTLRDAFDALSTKEKMELLVYTNSKTPEQFFLNLRNHVENLAR